MSKIYNRRGKLRQHINVLGCLNIDMNRNCMYRNAFDDDILGVDDAWKQCATYAEGGVSDPYEIRTVWSHEACESDVSIRVMELGMITIESMHICDPDFYPRRRVFKATTTMDIGLDASLPTTGPEMKRLRKEVQEVIESHEYYLSGRIINQIKKHERGEVQNDNDERQQ